MNIQELIQKGWADHADDAAGVADRLPAGVELIETAADIANLAALVVHVYGEHLGRWQDGHQLLHSLVEHQAFDSEAAAGKSLYRSMAVLEYCKGNRAEVERLEELGRSDGEFPHESDRVRVRAVAASALAGQKRTTEAVTAFHEALELAAYGPTGTDPAARALAITGNNLACDLEEKADRSAEEVELMKLAARTGRKYWEIAGNWENVGWAEFRLAMSPSCGGGRRSSKSRRSVPGTLLGQRRVAILPLLAEQALARVLHASGRGGSADARDRAAALVDTVPEESRDYCRGELAKLDDLLG